MLNRQKSVKYLGTVCPQIAANASGINEGGIRSTTARSSDTHKLGATRLIKVTQPLSLIFLFSAVIFFIQMKYDNQIPEVIPPDPMMEQMVRKTKVKLAEISKNGKGKFKVKTASGCWNDYIPIKK